MIALHYWVVAASLLILSALAAGAVGLRRDLAAPFRGLRPRTWGLLLLLFGAHALFVRPGLPHAPWHEQHAAEFIVGVDGPLGFGGLESMHGPVYTQVMKAAAALVGRPFSVSLFSLNYLFSLAAALLLFLWVYALSREERLAWAATGLLLFLPARLRLSTTEDMFILVELFSLAALLCFTLSVQRRRPPLFALGTSALLALMHLRAEMMLLAPALAVWGGWLFREEFPEGFFRERWVRGSAAAAVLLAAPRAVEVLLWNDPRIRQIAPLEPMRLIEKLGWTGLNAFFSPDFTPVLYPVLFVVGMALLGLRHRRAFWFAASALLVLVAYYAQHLSCVSLKVRSALASQYLFVCVAAFGFHDPAGRLGRRGSAGAGILLAGILAFTPYAYRGFLRTLYTSQVEFRLLERVAGTLPRDAVVVTLSHEDENGLLQNRSYQRDILEHAGRGKGFILLGVRRFFGLLNAMDPDGVYFYAGAPCVSVPWTVGDPGSRMGKSPGYTHPLCLLMEETFLLEPVLTGALTGPSLSWDRIEGEDRIAGLYRIRGWRPSGKKGAPTAAGVPGAGDWEPSSWIPIARAAVQAGQKQLGLAALARAEAAASSGDRVFLRTLREELERPPAGAPDPAPAESSGTRAGPGAPREVNRSVWLSPLVKRDLLDALELIGKGDERGGLARYRRIVRVSAPETAWPVEAYCRGQAAECAPLQRSLARLQRLNDEGIRLAQAGKTDLAMARFEEALALDPSDVDTLLNAANLAAAAKSDFARALGLLDRAAALRPAKPGLLPTVLNFRAAALAGLGRGPEAAADLREALRLAPRDWPLRPETERELSRLNGTTP